MTPIQRVRFRHHALIPPLGDPDAARQAAQIPPDFWIEAEYGDWVAAYRLVQQEGYPVIGEFRLFPREPQHRLPGEWSGSTHDKSRASAPAGGITARLLRKLRLRSDWTEGLRAGNRYLKLVPVIARPHLQAAGVRRMRPLRRTPKHGQRGWSVEVLLNAALFYVQHTGRRPVADLAAAWQLKHVQARDLLQKARRKGFLTAGVQGTASRGLTNQAKALLSQKASTR